MPETVRQCALCGSERSTLFDQRSYHDRLVSNRRCLGCGLVYQSPRMSASESAAFYAAEYRLLQEGNSDPTARNMLVQQRRARSLLGFCQPILGSLQRHLDIGCSLGILLGQFQEVFHNQAVGVEPGEAHREHARRQGLVVYPTLEELENAGEAPFDLVSMSHVLEHLPDPLATLVHLRETLLAREGRLLIEVPNLYSHDSFEVAHLYAFSAHSLRETLRKAGFEILRFEKHGRPNSALLPLFLTVLCKPADRPDVRPVRPEHLVGMKRRAGMFYRRLVGKLLPKQAWLVQV
jgi:SAM-dependent methyltransferase